jgi:hypothetical protein
MMRRVHDAPGPEQVLRHLLGTGNIVRRPGDENEEDGPGDAEGEATALSTKPSNEMARWMKR